MAEFEPGVEVKPPNSAPYKIAELVSSDYLHIDTQGNYHTLLTQPLRSGRRFYRYYQFDHIDPFARQQLHIFYQKVGTKIVIPADEMADVPKMGEPLPEI